jgi:hypothetical protein
MVENNFFIREKRVLNDLLLELSVCIMFLFKFFVLCIPIYYLDIFLQFSVNCFFIAFSYMLFDCIYLNNICTQ